MTEQNQARDLVATLRDALRKLAWTLERTRTGVNEIATQAARIRTSVEALGALGQPEDTAIEIENVGRRRRGFSRGLRRTRIRDPRRAGGGGHA